MQESNICSVVPGSCLGKWIHKVAVVGDLDLSRTQGVLRGWLIAAATNSRVTREFPNIVMKECVLGVGSSVVVTVEVDGVESQLVCHADDFRNLVKRPPLGLPALVTNWA